MLKLTKQVEYGLISLVYISEKEDGNLSSAREIASNNLIPLEILAKTLQRLAANNLIESVKGPKGGYRISSQIDEINIVEFIEMLEGPVGLVGCLTAVDCEQECSCSIKNPMNMINDKIIDVLKNIKISQFTKPLEGR